MSTDRWMEAVQAGDVIRRHASTFLPQQQQHHTTNHTNTNGSNTNKYSFIHSIIPPGIFPGILASTMTAFVTWPIRQSLFRFFTNPIHKGYTNTNHNNKQFQIFLELIITPIQVVSVVQMGLLVGSLYGSHYYLQQFLLYQQQQQPIEQPIEQNQFTTTTTTTTTTTKHFSEDICHQLLSTTPSTTPIPSSTTNTSHTHWNAIFPILKTYQQVLEQCRRRQQQQQ